MKKIVQILAPFLLTFSLAGGVAAASSCSISNTGPNSDNICVNENTNSLTVTCKNDVDVVFVNGQDAGSGPAILTGNTEAGFSFSGNAVNTNSSTLGLDVGCGPKTSSVTPPAGGQGGGPVAVAPVVSTPAKTLPKTGSDSKVAVAAIATGAFALIAGAARFGALTYRKLF